MSLFIKMKTSHIIIQSHSLFILKKTLVRLSEMRLGYAFQSISINKLFLRLYRCAQLIRPWSLIGTEKKVPFKWLIFTFWVFWKMALRYIFWVNHLILVLGPLFCILTTHIPLDSGSKKQSESFFKGWKMLLFKKVTFLPLFWLI